MGPDTIDQLTRKLSNVSGETEDELQEGGKRLPAKLLVSVTSVPLREINGDSFPTKLIAVRLRISEVSG